jgi:hypothetical protein
LEEFEKLKAELQQDGVEVRDSDMRRIIAKCFLAGMSLGWDCGYDGFGYNEVNDKIREEELQ